MTPAPPCVVLVYGDKPSGHSSAAVALRAELERQAPSVRAVELALSSEVAPVVGPVIKEAYLSLIQMSPQLWNYLYDNRTVAAALKELREPLSALHRARLRSHFKTLAPDLIVCTHALACAVVATEKEQGSVRAPLAAALTDYGVHEYWLSAGVDLYLAPSEPVRRELIKRGVPAARVRVTGIPVHPRFREAPDRGRARRELRLPADKPVALIEGGSKGLGPIQRMLDAALDVPEAHALVVCGRNRELFDSLSARFSHHKRVRLLGYTRRMPSCYAAADVLIGKPGGVTAAEAAACGLPLMIVEPLPGQELKNSAYLTAHGAALQVDDLAALAPAVGALLRSPKGLAAMSEAARRAAPLDSAARAVGELRRLWQPS